MKILVCGSHGRMGTLVTKHAKEYDCEVIAVINHGSDFYTEVSKRPDICIDFSTPECLLELCKYASNSGVKVLSGTTGLNDGQNELLKNFSTKIPILHASNFSIGVFVLNNLVKLATKSLPEIFDIEIIERHHSAKKDSPSGTAMTLLQTINSVDKHHVLFGRYGENKRVLRDLCIHSVRGGDIVGEHEVMFAGQGERIELIHRATDRKIFACGALYTAKLFMDIEKPGLYGLSDIL